MRIVVLVLGSEKREVGVGGGGGGGEQQLLLGRVRVLAARLGALDGHFGALVAYLVYAALQSSHVEVVRRTRAIRAQAAAAGRCLLGWAAEFICRGMNVLERKWRRVDRRRLVAMIERIHVIHFVDRVRVDCVSI